MMLLGVVPEKVFGLPSHPLLVHGAVVLVPLAALALIATGWNSAWRQRYYFAIMLLAVGGAGSAFLAKESGESLKQTLRAVGKRAGDHPDQGDRAFILAGLLAATCIVLYAYETFGDRIRTRLGWTERFRLPFDENVALYAVSIPIAALAIGAMIVAGHSGAQLVWKTAP